MLKIGDFSKLSRISVRMLRHYDELGLLTPDEVDAFTGYRYYGERKLMEANRILALRDMGFGLTAVREILSVYDDAEALKRILQLHRSELQKEAGLLEQKLLLLETTLQRLGKDETAMEYSVVLKELPRRYVASVRRLIPGYEQEGMLWGILAEEATRLKVQFGDPSYSIAIFHDSEYKEGDVDVEIQMSVKGEYENTDRMTFRTVGPDRVASVTYQGSYQQIGEVNQAVVNWVADNGYEMNGPMFNIYHIGPHDTMDSSKWLTEVCFPVKKK